MKMIIVTTVEEYEKEVFKLFKKAGIENFSGSDIDGYKNTPPMFYTNSWFPSEKGGAASNLFFPSPRKKKSPSFSNCWKNSTKKVRPQTPFGRLRYLLKELYKN